MKYLAIVLFLFCSVRLFAQDRVSGIVRNQYGQYVAGAFIKYTHRLKGTITDSSGAFSITRFVGDTIQVTSMGYKLQDIVVVENVQSFNVVLIEDTTLLEGLMVRYNRKPRSSIELGYYQKPSSLISIWDFPGINTEVAVYIPNERVINGLITGIKLRLGHLNAYYHLRVKLLCVDTITGFPSSFKLMDSIIPARRLKNKFYLNIDSEKIKFPEAGVFVSLEWLPANANIPSKAEHPDILSYATNQRNIMFRNNKNTGWKVHNMNRLEEGYELHCISIVVSY